MKNNENRGLPLFPLLILASSSPRRRDLLQDAGFSFRIEFPEVDEVRRDDETPDGFALRAATEKAEWVAARADTRGAIVLGADTVVADGNESLGKPHDADTARRMLAQLSGRTHRVVTGVCLVPVSPDGADAERFAVSTFVTFRTLTPETIEAYIATGEPHDKAGAYAIQGHGGALVSRIDGSYTNVVGLPIEEVVEALRERFRLVAGTEHQPHNTRSSVPTAGGPDRERKPK